MSSPGLPQRLGKYELQEKLGHGGVAEVWKAFDTELHRYVAIKLLHANLQTDPEFMTRFSREARFIAALHHPNIVQIHDFQTAHSFAVNAPVAYMVMDYVEGSTLAQYIHETSRVGKFPAPTDIVQLFASISKAIDHAHQEGMIHRDIKPANILLDRRHTADNSIGEPVLTDFGIARIVGTTSDTINGMLLGTPLYISPEQAQGYPGTERSDIYSLGVILYEICTGVCPFRNEGVTAILMQQIGSAPTPPALFNPAVPPPLTAVILRAIAKDPAERFSSASALTAALAEAFQLPIPAGLFLSGRPSNPMMQPTHFRPDRSGPSSYLMPQGMEVQWSQPLPAMNSQVSTPLLAPLTGSPISGVGFPVAPSGNTPLPFASPFAAPNVQAPVSSPISGVNFPPPTSPPSLRSGRGWKRLLILLFVILFVVSSTFVVLNVLNTGRAGPPPPTVVGTLAFTDSGQYDRNTTVGYNDVLTLSLRSVTPPGTGKAYFAWLLPDQGDDQTVPLLLGRLSVNAGKTNLQYISPAHTNLLAQYSGVRITEQSADGDPGSPSLDPQTWRWEGWVPHVPDPEDPKHFSLLSHVRHLLAKDPTLQASQISGGLVIWMTRNVAKIAEWSSAAQGSWEDENADLVHRHLLRILDYLDGQTYVWQDVPQGSDWLVDPVAGKFGLLNYTQNQATPGYLQHVDHHLSGMANSPGHTDEQKKVAIQVDRVITRMINDLTQVRKDAVNLVKLSNEQLLQPDTLTLLNEMVTLTTKTNGGSFDSGDNENQGGGVIWLNARIHQLATISLQTSNRQ